MLRSGKTNIDKVNDYVLPLVIHALNLDIDPRQTSDITRMTL